MEIKEIDSRLNSDITDFENNLKKHEIFLKEAEGVKLSFSAQGEDLLKDYKEKLDILTDDYMNNVEDINEIKNEIETYKETFNNLILDIKRNEEEAEAVIKKIIATNDSRWNSQKKSNKKEIDNINEIENENKSKLEKTLETYNKLLDEYKLNSAAIKKNEEIIMDLEKRINLKMKDLEEGFELKIKNVQEDYDKKLEEIIEKTDNKFLEADEDKKKILTNISNTADEFNAKLQDNYNNMIFLNNKTNKKLNIFIVISIILFITIIILLSR